MKEKLSNLYKYPIGIMIEKPNDFSKYIYMGRNEIGYYFFNGYTIVYDVDIWPDIESEEDIEIYLKEFKFDKEKIITGLWTYILILIEEPEMHKEDIKKLLKIIDIVNNDIKD